MTGALLMLSKVILPQPTAFVQSKRMPNQPMRESIWAKRSSRVVEVSV